MKNNVLTFMFSILLIMPVFAGRPGSGAVINQKEIRDNIESKIANKETKNYLGDSALDYFKTEATIGFDGITHTYMDMDHPLYDNNDAILSYMEYRTDYAFSPNISQPALTDQFDIMTYLMYTGRNEDLEYFLNKDWAGNMYLYLNSSEGERTITLLTQAVLSNNKEALKIVRDSIVKNKSLPLMTSYQHTMLGLIPENLYTDYEYDNDYLKERHIYAQNNLTAESIAQTVIDGDIITLYDYLDIIRNKYKSKNSGLFFDALELLIDYRVKMGLN